MKDAAQTNAQLIHEVAALRRKVTALEAVETARQRATEEIRRLNAELQRLLAERTTQRDQETVAHRHAAQALQHSEDRFRAAQDISLEAFTILQAIRDAQGRIVDFEWTYANRAAGAILKQPPASLVGQRLLAVLPGNRENQALFERYGQIVETGQGDVVELRYRAEGIDGWFQNMAVRLDDGVAISFSDITQRKQAEAMLWQSKADLERLVAERTAELQAKNARLEQESADRKRTAETLRESELRFSSIFHASPIGIGISRLADGVFLDANAALLNLFDCPRAELIGHTSRELNLWANAADRARLYAILHAEGRMQNVEFELRLRTGASRHALVSAEVIALAGEPCMLGIAHDITERKRMEAALERERSLLRTLIDNVPDYIYVKDTASRFLLGNRAVAQVMGAAAIEDLIGKTDFDFFPPDLAAGYYADEQDVIRAGRAQVSREEPLIDPAGRRSWLLTTQVPLRDSQGTVWGLVGIGRDITDRQRAEEALRESEARFRDVLEHSLDVQYRRNLQTDTYDYMSSAITAITGYTPAEMKAMPNAAVLSRIHPDDLPPIAETLREAEIHDHRQYQLEYRFRAKNGEYHWFDDLISVVKDAQGRPWFWIGSMRDITERKRAEEALREQERQFRAILDNIPDLAWLKDRAGRYIAVNKAYASSMGQREPQAYVGKTDGDFWPAEYVRAYQQDDHEVIATGQERRIEEFTATPEGTKCWETVKRPIFDEHGAVIGTVGIARDITERKRAEAELRQAKDAADAANRAKSQFLANLSHELRTPLNALLGYTQLFLQDPRLTEKQQDAMQIMQRSGEHLLALINDLLDLARIEAAKLELRLAPFQVPNFVNTVVAMMRPRAEQKGLALTAARRRSAANAAWRCASLAPGGAESHRECHQIYGTRARDLPRCVPPPLCPCPR